MKALLILLTLMCSTAAFARIGETTQDLDKRYGRPLEKIPGKLESRRYAFRGFTILVGLDQGISQCEVYQKQDKSRMTEAEIRGLLEVNSGKSPWRDEADENIENFVYWSKDKKNRVAIYNLAAHRLLVTSKPYLARFANLANASNQKKIEGF